MLFTATVLFVGCGVNGNGGDSDGEIQKNIGLDFNSWNASSDKRTSLMLCPDHGITATRDFRLNFNLMLNTDKPYGNVVHILSSDGKNGVKVMFTMDNATRQYIVNIVSGDKIIPIQMPFKVGQWMKCEIDLDIDLGKVHFKLDNYNNTVGLGLKGMGPLYVTFGAVDNVSNDVVDMAVSDIRVATDGKTRNRWLLGYHNGDTCYDEMQHQPAVVKWGNWMIDRSMDWKPVLTFDRDTDVGLAYDSISCRFFVIGPGTIETYNTAGKRLASAALTGSPAISALSHVGYDQSTDKIMSYDFVNSIFSSVSPDGGAWSFSGPVKSKESRYYCRAIAFNPEDSCHYFFGGYGFFVYSDKLHRIDARTGRISEINYSPRIPPRMSAAACVVGDELFIAGGRGNEAGRQEVNEHFYYDLYAINLRTRRSRCLWARDNEVDMGVSSFCSTMVFDPVDSTFYAMQDGNRGRMMKIWMNEPRVETVSNQLDTRYGIVASEGFLFVSPREHRIYVAYNMKSPGHKFRIAIYSLDTPLLDSIDVSQNIPDSSWMAIAGWIAGAVVVIGGVTFIIIRRRKHCKARPAAETAADVGEPVLPAFTTNRSSILFLGGFSAYNDKGEDITASFTPRLKNLLILLILNTENNKNGISAENTANLLWDNAEIMSTRNNLNVSLRRLRMLVDQGFGLTISNDNGFLHINRKDGVFCDYHELLARMEEIKRPDITEARFRQLSDEIVSLLSFGTLLPEMSEEWLDSFKSSFSNISLDFLLTRLKHEMQARNYPMAGKLADIIFAHDSLNDAALSAKCTILTLQGRRGIAKNVYNHFCKEYRQVYGEDYDTPFARL